MKHNFKLTFLLTLIILLLFSTVSSFALTEKTMIVDETQQVHDSISEIENILTLQGSSVESGLQYFMSELEKEKAKDIDIAEKQKLQNLLDLTDELLQEYETYKEASSTFAANNSVHDTTIAAVISYFAVNEYFLAAELLGHAKDNKVLDSTYSPYYGQRVRDSSVLTTIRNTSQTSGSAAFPETSGTVNMDLYYAIHTFRWVKRSPAWIYILDRYDFGLGDYAGLAGIAINAMYNAQQAGVLTPYEVSIRTT